jgi:hypothetical protein
MRPFQPELGMLVGSVYADLHVNDAGVLGILAESEIGTLGRSRRGSMRRSRRFPRCLTGLRREG